MKRSAYKKAWSIIMIAVMVAAFGFVYEPLLAVLGMTVIFTSVLASSIERKNRKYEELLGDRVFEETYVTEREIGFVPHKAV